jgi:hypothetical protein
MWGILSCSVRRELSDLRPIDARPNTCSLAAFVRGSSRRGFASALADGIISLTQGPASTICFIIARLFACKGPTPVCGMYQMP